MSDIEMSVCDRKNLCVDCDNTECLHCGTIMADCPKYGCDNNKQDDCEHCEFIKEFQESERKRYEREVKDGEINRTHQKMMTAAEYQENL